MGSIHFFTEDITFALKNKNKLRHWILSAISDHQKAVGEINYIFTSDKYLLKLNKQYLNHTTLTDIITFDQSNEDKILEGDVYISIERVQENAKNIGVAFIVELHRVMIHGILHLLGYQDKKGPDKIEMRKKENHYLALRII
jgi:rRNA maturation RNase YbeY